MQAGAEKDRSEAVAIYGELHAADPNNSGFEHALAANQLALAILSQGRGDIDAAARYIALARGARATTDNDRYQEPALSESAGRHLDERCVDEIRRATNTTRLHVP